MKTLHKLGFFLSLEKSTPLLETEKTFLAARLNSKEEKSFPVRTRM